MKSELMQRIYDQTSNRKKDKDSVKVKRTDCKIEKTGICATK